MRAIDRRQPAASGGFTLLEAMIALCIMGIMGAIGIPNLIGWLAANRAAGAAEFYAEGFRLARAEAVKHNSASRMLLTENANGQMDWQVDICFPTTAVPICDNVNGEWSTTAASAGGDREGAAGFKSVFRAADALPKSSVLAPSRLPTDATDVYFTSLGWVNTFMTPSLARITLAPVVAGAFPSASVVLTLAGVATKCDPNVAVGDSRRCPP